MTGWVHGVALFSFTGVLAWCFARLEIEIEGPHGWASSLPTWRIDNHPVIRWFMGGRPLTGYHLYALGFVALVFHLPLVLLGQGSWLMELRIIACLVLFWIMEDFLWFLLNPAWGWRRFRPSEIPWHPRWLLGIPLEYISLGVPAGIVFGATFVVG